MYQAPSSPGSANKPKLHKYAGAKCRASRVCPLAEQHALRVRRANARPQAPPVPGRADEVHGYRRRAGYDRSLQPVAILEQHIVWLRQRPSVRSGRPLAKTAVATYHAAVLDCFKWATRRKLVSDRFRWAEMAANAAETLGKVHKRSARHDRRIPLLVAYVDSLPLPDVRQRLGISRLELLRDRAAVLTLVERNAPRGGPVAQPCRPRRWVGELGAHHRQGLEGAHDLLG
jgi:hypothetical protein